MIKQIIFLQFLIQRLDNILWPEVRIISLHFYRVDRPDQFDRRNQHIQAYLPDRTVHYLELIPVFTHFFYKSNLKMQECDIL